MNSVTTPTDFAGLVNLILHYISLLVPILIALTFAYVSWGVINAWIIHGDDEGSVQNGRTIAVVGVVALTGMFVVWGLVALLSQSLFGS